MVAARVQGVNVHLLEDREMRRLIFDAWRSDVIGHSEISLTGDGTIRRNSTGTLWTRLLSTDHVRILLSDLHITPQQFPDEDELPVLEEGLKIGLKKIRRNSMDVPDKWADRVANEYKKRLARIFEEHNIDKLRNLDFIN